MPDLIENSMSTCNYRFMRIAVNNFTVRRNMVLLNLVFTAYITKSELSFKLFHITSLGWECQIN